MRLYFGMGNSARFAGIFGGRLGEVDTLGHAGQLDYVLFPLVAETGMPHFECLAVGDG